MSSDGITTPGKGPLMPGDETGARRDDVTFGGYLRQKRQEKEIRSPSLPSYRGYPRYT